MKKRKAQILVIALLTSAIPAVLTYLGTDNNIIDILYKGNYIGSAVDINKTKNTFRIIGGILSFLLITYQMAEKSIKVDSMNAQINGLLYQNKCVFEKAFEEIVGKHVGLDIRIFVPISPIISNPRKKQLYFAIKNYEGLCNAGTTNHLKFKVKPESEKEGLVGLCYNNKAMLYDDDLKKNNSVRYGLSPFQISKTRELEFSITCPLYDNNNSVVAIIAIDGREKITIDRTNETAIANSVVTFSQLLYENEPDMFKPIRRVML